MNRIKKFASLLLALVMALALAVPAMASGNTEPVEANGPYTITVNGATIGHTYEAYQIFSGDLAKQTVKKTVDGQEVEVEEFILSNIVWGSGVNEADAIVEARKVVGNDVNTAAEVAERLNNSNAVAFAKAMENALSATHTDVTASETTCVLNVEKAGYYLVKDQKDSATGDDSITAFMLQVVGPATVTAKAGTPEPDKKVKDKNDTENTTSDWQYTADYDIGDEIEYELKATLPNSVNNYKTYKLVFKDELSVGLTCNMNSVVVKVNGNEIAQELYEKVLTEVATGEGEARKVTGHMLTITIDDVKKAGIGAGDGDVITVEYTATLNDQAVIGVAGNPNTLTLEFSNNPNNDGDGETGTTPPVTAIVFTFETIVNKVNQERQPLTGATFRLSKWIGAPTEENPKAGVWQVIKEYELNETDTEFSFNGLDDGVYKLEEVVVPDGYNKMNDVYFKVEAEHTGDGKTNTLTKLDVYEIDKDGNKVANGDTMKLDFTVSTEDGTAETDVMNMRGATLPETGGIGTTIFYVVGGLLVAGAVILLVTKKRMSVEDK